MSLDSSEKVPAFRPVPDSETVVGDLDGRAQEVITRAQDLIASMEAQRDPVELQRIRDELKVVRAALFQIVVEKHGGDRDAAILSDDFESDFQVMTQAIEPPKAQPTRKFPGARKVGVGDNGRSFRTEK